jgi:hypothetical protein
MSGVEFCGTRLCSSVVEAMEAEEDEVDDAEGEEVKERSDGEPEAAKAKSPMNDTDIDLAVRGVCVTRPSAV